jgi:hypothetical protein
MGWDYKELLGNKKITTYPKIIKPFVEKNKIIEIQNKEPINQMKEEIKPYYEE